MSDASRDEQDQQSALREGPPQTPEPRETRLRRLRLRCWRRGIREMDLILGGFFDAAAASLDDDELDALERLMSIDDQTLYRWVSGAGEPPEEHSALVSRLRASASATKA